MSHGGAIDTTDARILLALTEEPRATAVALTERLGLSRNTVQARWGRLERDGTLGPFTRRVDAAALGYPLTAFVTMRVDQLRLTEVGTALGDIPEVVEVYRLSGDIDLLARVVAADADDLYRIAGQLHAVPGVERSSTSLAMNQLVPHRLTPLLERAAEGTGRRRG
ncbi:Lrp/AsnC family transcriptional regulator [Streptomyces diastaticus]|uniref:Lrp/AsnC family transcriptional regulator n=1 Tax=Streptomyces diastaticus TaxID=1956 RepID=UPI0037CCD992